MRIKCEYCGGYIDDSEERCKNCGASNLNLKRQASNVPRTIEELQGWYIQQNLPPKEVTRFFIGEDYKGAKAFGIYREEGTGNVVVYKNKADGSRAVRYRGKDEAYGVNELYMKLKEEILKQKSNNLDKKSQYSGQARSLKFVQNNKNAKKASLVNVMVWAIFIFIFIFIISSAIKEPDRGYYNYDGNQYYYLDNDWYSYDSYTDSWSETTVSDELSDNYSDYYESNSYDTSYNTSDFSDTSYYDDWYSSSGSDSSWDSGSSWDSSDSWGDSGGWDSDW